MDEPIEDRIHRELWRRYSEAMDQYVSEMLEGGSTGEPIGVFNMKPVEQPWRLPADWREHVGDAPTREHIGVAPLAGEVMERDEHGDWRTVSTGGFPVTDNRRVRFTRLEGEAAKLFKIPYPGS